MTAAEHTLVTARAQQEARSKCVIAYNEPPSGGLELYVCSRCGAMVVDFALHDEWHEARQPRRWWS